MTAQLMVERVPARPVLVDPVRNPLATRRGAELLCLLVEAEQRWRPLTGRQRDALRRGVHALIVAVQRLDPATVPDEGLPLELPALPVDVHPATAASLERRGLVADGRLTALAVEVVRYGDHDRRPVITARPIGERL